MENEQRAIEPSGSVKNRVFEDKNQEAEKLSRVKTKEMPKEEISIGKMEEKNRADDKSDVKLMTGVESKWEI